MSYRAGTLAPPVKRPRERREKKPLPELHPADLWHRARISRARLWLPRNMVQINLIREMLEHFFADPQFREIMQAAPQTARLFRPWCRLLGVENLPDALKPLAARPRKARTPKQKPEPLPPLHWRGYEFPPGARRPPGYPSRPKKPFEWP
jgi:hypothetical protein